MQEFSGLMQFTIEVIRSLFGRNQKKIIAAQFSRNQPLERPLSLPHSRHDGDIIEVE